MKTRPCRRLQNRGTPGFDRCCAHHAQQDYSPPFGSFFRTGRFPHWVAGNAAARISLGIFVRIGQFTDEFHG